MTFTNDNFMASVAYNGNWGGVKLPTRPLSSP